MKNISSLFAGLFLFLNMNKLRLATVSDAEAMLNIYSPFILNSGITQEVELPSLEDFGKRVVFNLMERPWLVCEIEGEVAGYAYAGKHRERSGYQWCTEPSVYISEKYQRLRVALALYSALFDILKIQGYVNAYAVITLPNEKSVAFHENFGFSYLTTYRKIGYKLNEWHDVGWWELQINPHEPIPTAPFALPEIDISMLNQILYKAGSLLKK